MNDAMNGSEPGLAKPLEHLRSILIPSETLEAWAIQRRIFALTHRRLLIAATSGRLILLTRKLLGGFDVSGVRWQDLEEVTLRVGMLGADLLVRAGRATDLASQGARDRSVWSFKDCAKTRRRRSIESARPRTSPGARSAGCASWKSYARAPAESKYRGPVVTRLRERVFSRTLCADCRKRSRCWTESSLRMRNMRRSRRRSSPPEAWLHRRTFADLK